MFKSNEEILLIGSIAAFGGVLIAKATAFAFAWETGYSISVLISKVIGG